MLLAMADGPLSDEILELIASGVDVYVATRDHELEPECMFAMGIRIHGDRQHLTVYLPEALASATCRNLEHNGEIAVTIERPRDCRSVQMKGKALGTRVSDDGDRDFQALFRGALVEQFEG